MRIYNLSNPLQSFVIANSSNKTNEGHLLISPSKKLLKTLKSKVNFFDHPTTTTLEIYGREGTETFLLGLGCKDHSFKRI